ncbi:MAG: S-layer homology domain-containing protein [Oscillibacter sp.]
MGNSKLTNKSGDTITVEKGGKLSISDSVGTGVVDNTSHGKGAIVNSGEVTLNGGTFKRSAEKGTYSPYVNGGNSWYTIANYGTMEINTGVTVENAGGYSSMIRNGGDVTADCNLTIEGGNFAGGVNTVKNDSFGVLTINGGNFSNTAQYVIMNWNKAEITAGTFQTLDTASAVLFTSTYGDDANTVGKLTISGGEFKHASDTQEMIVDHYDESNSGAAAVTGGRFDADISKYIPSDYVQSADGTVEKLGESNAVAKVGDTYYKTLAEAVAAANNATVTLLKDVTANVTIPADETITLNLNGMTLTNVDDHTILNNGNLTITGTGRVDNISHAKGALYNKGTVVINGGTFDRSKENGKTSNDSGSNSWYTIKNVGSMTIHDGATVQTAGNNAALGKFSSLVSNGYFDANDYSTNKGLDQPILTIDGGTFRGGLNTIKNDDRAKLTINGGTFSNYYQAVVQNHNIAEITGGTFTAASDANAETYGIYNCGCGADIDLGTLTVSGGTFTGATYAVAEVSSQNAIVNISGGQFAGTKAAIIKSSTSNATIAISGGSFSQSVERKYLDRSLNAELKRASGETPYSYYTSMNDALAAAKPGDTVTDLNATTESKVTLTLKYNDGATADTTYNVASGTTITLPTPAHRSGYTFNGWYDGSKFYAAGASYKVSATATLNASWSYISSGSSSYDPTYSVSTPSKTENGSVTVSPKSASKGSTVTITVKPDSGYVLETLTVTDKNGNELTLKDKGDGKYTFTMPAGKVEVKATFMEDNSVLNFFYDVPNGAYFYEAVKWAVDKGVTNGLSDTMFGPYESCTRAQIVTFLWRAAGSPEPKAMSSFTDVPASAYYAKAVAWAVENGITNGMTETTFAPNATCTRGQSVTFLYRALKGTASGSANFTDVKSDAFYADAINWAVANNVTNGTSNTTFSPNADCTRAEIVTFLYRAYQGK